MTVDRLSCHRLRQHWSGGVARLGPDVWTLAPLRFATEPGDSRVVSVAAVCTPLDLGRAQQAIDRPDRWLYRRYLLSNLARLYAAVAARRPVPRLEVCWVADGGHVGFPRGVDLGLDPAGGRGGSAEREAEAAAPSVDGQVLAWLREARAAPAAGSAVR